MDPVPLVVPRVQPVERCGDFPIPLFPSQVLYECALRPGHQGSHADEYGGRWHTMAAGQLEDDEAGQ